MGELKSVKQGLMFRNGFGSAEAVATRYGIQVTLTLPRRKKPVVVVPSKSFLAKAAKL